MSSVHNRAESEAADALAALAQGGSRRSMSVSSNHDPATSIPPFSPTAIHIEGGLKREESQEPLSARLAHFGSTEQDTKTSGIAGPAAIPLFQPAQVDRSTDRKSSTAANTSRPVISKKSASPSPAIGVKGLGEEDSSISSAAVNDFGLRGARIPSEANSVSTEPAPTIPRKRAAPKSSMASQKKGTAKKSAGPSAKRRRMDPDTPTSNDTRDTTPASFRGRGGAKGRNSMTPALESSTGMDDDDDEAEDDDSNGESDGEALFCICRKPDDHKYMIACDGGCDDWFHSRCVNISEDEGKLIDKFICPNCVVRGEQVTTWRPMCRRPTCRKPAALTKDETSKYCSDSCGLLFFQGLISGKYTEDNKSKTKRGKGSKSDMLDYDSKMGAISPFELKALLDSVDDVTTFRKLGNGSLRAPGVDQRFTALASPSELDSAQVASLTPTEQSEIDRITAKKEKLRDSRATLEDRKRYFTLAKERLAAYIESHNLKPKDVCGFDQRLSWSPERFLRWRNSPSGVAAFDRGSLEVQTNGTNGDMELDGDEEEIAICTRKRCERHKMWQRLQVEDARFEESQLADEMRELDRLERELRERAALRSRREVSGLLKKQGSVTKALVANAFD
jgi:COMPASS component SPP1